MTTPPRMTKEREILPDCMMPDGAEPCMGYTQLLKERDELKALLDQATKHVLPGECDTGDAYLKIMRELRAETEDIQRVATQALAADDTASAVRDTRENCPPNPDGAHRFECRDCGIASPHKCAFTFTIGKPDEDKCHDVESSEWAKVHRGEREV